MANSTFLQLVQDSCGEMGFVVPSTVISNTNQQVTDLRYAANSLVRELCREHQWQNLTKQYIFTTVFYQYTATTVEDSTTLSVLSSTTGLTTTPTYFMVTGAGIPQNTMLVSVDSGASTAVMNQSATASGTTVTLTFSQTLYAPPSDYDRQVDRTHFDKSRHWEMLGPETAQQWSWLQSAYISTGPRIRYRWLGGFFQIWPPESVNDVCGFEYVSKYSVLATADTITPTKAQFTVDTDTCIFDDRLMVIGIKKKYFELKGMDVTAFERVYMAKLSEAKAMEAGSPTLSMNPGISEILIGYDNIPDSGFGA